MNHKHWVMSLPAIEMATRDGKHYYGDKLYPSVTTILSDTGDKHSLEKWRRDVGEDVADYISDTASTVGTEMHRLNERYLNDMEIGTNNLLSLAHHRNMVPYLDKIAVIYGTETRLCSDKYRFGGTCDCIGVYDDKVSVIDFKANNKTKRIEWIQDYLLQLAGYAILWTEMTGIKITQGVSLISSAQNTMNEHIIYTDAYREGFLMRLRQYHDMHKPKEKYKLP